MPSRIIREGINTSRAVSGLTIESQLLYRALLLIVDDWGRFEYDVDLIRAACFPRQLERWPPARIEDCFAEIHQTLTDRGQPLVARYTVESKEYLQVTNFLQRPQSKSKCPGPDGSFSYPKRVESTETHSEPPIPTGNPPAPTVKAAKPNGAHTADLTLSVAVWFEEFWSLFWRKEAKKRAGAAFHAKVKTYADWEKIRRAVIAQGPEMLGRAVEHRPSAERWLRDERAADEESPPQSARREAHRESKTERMMRVSLERMARGAK